MLLKSIKLENFRQFRNESIDFAQGEGGKNVTIIIGENGTGKTTQDPADEERFDSYVRGGIDVLYEKLVEGENTPEAFANRLYEFIDEFNDRFNSEISTDDILQLCVNKS